MYPFLRVTASLIIGVYLHEAFQITSIPCYIVLLFVAIFLLLYSFSFLFTKRNVFKKSNIILGLTCFMFMGYISAHLDHIFEKPPISPIELCKSSSYYVTISSRAINTDQSTRYEAQIKKIKINDQWHRISSKVILYLAKDVAHRFTYSDQLLIKGNPVLMKNQTIPHAFDYSKFLQRKGIYLRDYITTDDFRFLGSQEGFSIDYYSNVIGDYFEMALTAHINNERELNIAKAMIIGRRHEISDEMTNVYQSTGTAHILAVSGLHVGILFLVFSRLFKPLKYKKLKYFYYSLIIFLIWTFAFVTGNSPSVQRASLMISVILFGEMISRKSNIYNSIFAAAFALLLIEPDLLFMVSFQLSFSAVIGIVYLYDKIYRLIYIPNELINFFWKILVLSISAQIATFPITIYYFHQFPTLFLLTNLLAIPTASIVLMGGIILLIASKITFLATFIGNELNDWIYFYNESLSLVSQFDFTRIEGLYIKLHSVFILILIIIFLTKFIETKKLYLFKTFTILLLILGIGNVYSHFQKPIQKKIIFYDVKGKSYFDVFRGNTCFTNALDAQEEIYYNLTPNRRNNHISSIRSLSNFENARLVDGSWLLYLQNNTVLYIKDFRGGTLPSTDIIFDYIVIDDSSSSHIHLIEEEWQFRKLILDSSVSIEKAMKIKKEAQNSSNIYSVSATGALEISI